LFKKKGKSTLISTLKTISKEYIQQKNEKQKTKEKIKQTPQITLKIPSNIFSLKFNFEEKEYLINLINDSNENEILNIIDGSILLIDCIEGVCLQTINNLKKLLNEKITPILMINKIDELLFNENNFDLEKSYNCLFKIIEHLNFVFEIGNNNFLNFKFDPVNIGNVIFSSSIHGWGFSLKKFSKIYEKKFGIDYKKIIKYFWNDYFYDLNLKKWGKCNENKSNDKNLIRGFVKFVIV
jgi:elongation factor 2